MAKERIVTFRCSETEAELMTLAAYTMGFQSKSEYVRQLVNISLNPLREELLARHISVAELLKERGINMTDSKDADACE